MKELVINVIDEDVGKVLQHFEAEMFEKYKKAVEPFVPLFAEIGCSLRLEQQWVNQIHHTWSTERLPLEKGYECWIHCIVERDGEEVHIISTDGEVDYYPLITSWTVSSYMRIGFKLRAYLYASVDDVDIDLTDFLSQLRLKHRE